MTVASQPHMLVQAETVPGVSSSPAKNSGQDLYDLLLRPNLLRVYPCVLGMVIGFVACCLSGAAAAKFNFYKDFHRFTNYTSPATLFYPTISQMLAIVNSRSSRTQTVVIIGGNSIFNGVGQRANEIWTDSLQKKLGANFAVFNFANCGSQSFEGAYWVAESLMAKGRKVLYVTVAMPTAGGLPDGSKVYGYLFWEAHEKKFLLRWPERDELIQRRLAVSSEKEKSAIEELKLRMQLDRYLHFQDLWSLIGYTTAFTVWTQDTAATPLKARMNYPDIQRDPSPIASRFRDSITFKRELKTVAGYTDGFFKITPTGCEPDDVAWLNLQNELKGLAPLQVRKNCLVLIAGNPNYYLERIGIEKKERIERATALSEKCWRDAGYNVITPGGALGDDDYQDCWHLVGSGGEKIADLIAHKVETLAYNLNLQKNVGTAR